MNISPEVSEVVRKARTLEDLVESTGKTMVLYIEDLGSSRSKTTVSPAGKIYSVGNLYDRTNDTLSWDPSVHAPVFSSDDSVARCPVYANSNDSIDDWNSESSYFVIMKNVKDTQSWQ